MEMKNKLLVITLATLAHATTLPITPYYSIRSQSVDAARELVGSAYQINLSGPQKIYGTFSATAEYTQSFRPSQIADCLFGSERITISGSRTLERGVNDWLADYFYLPTDFKSNVYIEPRIENALVDMNAYIGLSNWLDGLFFRIHAPLTWSRWSLNFKECIVDPGTNGFDQGYFTPLALNRDDLLDNFSEFAIGEKIADQTSSTPAVTFDSLHFARMDGCAHSTIRLAEIQMIFGWNFLNSPAYHLGAGLRLCAPTGSKIESDLLFKPVVGNGKHWELGGHITSHLALWENEPQDSSIVCYVDANITHLFRSRQQRTFDLKDKPFSRYMIAEQLNAPTIDGLTGAATPDAPPFLQFQNNFAPVANITTQNVFVHIAFQADVAAQLTYAHAGLTCDVGYNFWTRSCEKIKSLCPEAGCQFVAFDETWALKGDTQVYGFAAAADTIAPALTQGQAVPLSATQSLSNIHSGQNMPAQGSQDLAVITQAQTNPNDDNPQLALAGGTPTQLLSHSDPASAQIRTSIQPIMIKATDLNTAGTRGLSHKIYSHVSYTWLDCERYSPYVGLGGCAEFGINSHNTIGSTCSSSSSSSSCQNACQNCSLSQWGVWVKGGLSF